MWLQLILTSLALFALLAGWVLVQAAARRADPAGARVPVGCSQGCGHCHQPCADGDARRPTH